MSNVVPFRAKARTKTQTHVRDNAQTCDVSGGCEVVIFPGIRYERWTSDIAVEKGGPCGRRDATVKA